MANQKRNRIPYRSNYTGYKANHSSSYYRRKQQEDEAVLFVRRFICQSMICLCLLMSILVCQKLPNAHLYENVKSIMLGNFPFTKYEKIYQDMLFKLFPFDHRLTKEEEITVPTGGIQGTTVDEAGQVIKEDSTNSTFDVSQAISDIRDNMVLSNYENGTVIQTKKDEKIKSIISGIVLNVGTDDKISNYINIQLENDWTLTIGFVENRTVNQYQHIKVGDVLGVGSVIGEAGTELGEGSYYYLALRDKDGKYQDFTTYLDQFVQ